MSKRQEPNVPRFNSHLGPQFSFLFPNCSNLAYLPFKPTSMILSSQKSWERLRLSYTVTMIDIISNIGGTLGLFSAFSLLSGIEIIYWMVVGVMGYFKQMLTMNKAIIFSAILPFHSWSIFLLFHPGRYVIQFNVHTREKCCQVPLTSACAAITKMSKNHEWCGKASTSPKMG